MARVGLRIPEEDRQLIEEVSRARAEDLSDFVRRAIRKELVSLGYYSDDVGKAYGLASRLEASAHAQPASIK